MKERKKGQVIFEQVLIFSLSVAIFLAIYALFNIYQGYFKDNMLDDQTFSVANIILEGITKASKVPGNVTLVVNIPEKIADMPYMVEADGSEVKITIGNIERGFKTCGINVKSDGKKIASSYGKIIVYKAQNAIILK